MDQVPRFLAGTRARRLLAEGVSRSVIPALIALPLALAVCGCQLPSVQRARLMSVPEACESPRARVERLGRVLTEGVPALRGVAFRISARGGLGAWAWPGGWVEVSRSLVDLLDDAELSAALAHELAHLIEGPFADGALVRQAEDEALEQAADRRGCSLLVQHGISPHAMTAMLRKLASARPDRDALVRRVDAASLACGAASTHPPGAG